MSDQKEAILSLYISLKPWNFPGLLSIFKACVAALTGTSNYIAQWHFSNGAWNECFH